MLGQGLDPVLKSRIEPDNDGLRCPGDQDVVLADQANLTTDKISAVAVDANNGTITITLGGISQLNAANDLAYVPQIGGAAISNANSTGSINWLCNTAATTIDNKFLPANCRK